MTKQAEYSRKHYQANKGVIIQKNIARTQAVRRWVREFKLQNPCKYCSETEPCCLDFHHLNGEEKTITVALAVNLGWSVERLKTEIEKCEVVCANCHRKIHAGLIQ